MNLYGTVELGGTKTLVAVGNGEGSLGETLRLETGEEPGPVVDAVVEFLSQHELSSVGIASFGPLELRPGHPDFGSILATPKPGWSNFNLVSAIGGRIDVPVAIDTDVDGAALAEGRWGASLGLDDHAYITVGTGVGAGIVVGGEVVRGLSHPEFGHITVEKHPDDDYAGTCPFHHSCLEGLAAGPALEARFGARLSRLGEREREQAITLAAFYVSQAVRTLVYTVAPGRVVIGGGVSKMEGFHKAVRDQLEIQLAGYAVLPEHKSA
ncbi:MAG TPA: ROK family protein, partial [Acidimicrobiia bacterium]|nr:ROK family protein [Acidimicrobiia bacterium]